MSSHIDALLAEVYTRYVAPPAPVGTTDIRACNYSYRREVEGIPSLSYLCAMLPYGNVRPGRSLGFKLCVKCKNIPSFVGNATVTLGAKRRRGPDGKLTSDESSPLYNMKIVSPHPREVVMYTLQQVYEILSYLQHPDTGTLVAFTIQESPPQIINVIVGWGRSTDDLPGPQKIQRELKSLARYAPMKFPHIFITSDMYILLAVFFILAMSGKINTAGLRHEKDVRKVQEFEETAFRRLRPRIGEDTETPPLQMQRSGDDPSEYAEFCEHDRRRLMEAFDFPLVKQFNISDLSIATQKFKDKVRAPTLLNAGSYPSLAFYLREVAKYIRIYGSGNMNSLRAYFRIRDPFPPGELLDPVE